ncbi:flagellar hook-associated protein FlgL [Anaeromicropila populeti]|uniref:Flagellar hook-associated protein 3 FlgL n=1 Tax=Anaeromicropila populeti TaxID=37658 RepID=A0A1I6HWZ6_9FIRM|nr:flagellar hook-associated protein FlgL [Anaeromicropila populeti]SFR58981.1 flagellar hook-associated protein 3 FlgL [Anaeromicropila populeti]
MRVTSKMMTTSMLSNINKNKTNMSKAADQYATQQKIQRPSEDPVIAVRSLKYRTNLAELDQYLEKNVPDAMSWMEVTESALDNVNDILTKMNTYFNQGANDTLETTDRSAIIETLKQYKEQVYECANADNAGRYLFTGYRTDTPLVFEEKTENKLYEISEQLDFDKVNTISYVKADIQYTAGNTAQDYASMAATQQTAYRMQLSYGNIDSLTSLSYTTGGTTNNLSIHEVSMSDADAYDIDAYNTANGTTYDALWVKETGEIIISGSTYDTLATATDIQADYEKSSFEKDELRPEHYFDCKVSDLDGTGAVIAGTLKQYEKPEEQEIQYEVNFSQKITVNTMANQCITAELGNQIDDIIRQLKKVDEVEQKLTKIKSMIENKTYTGTEDAMNELLEQANTELTLQKNVLQEKFGNGLTTTTNVQEDVNTELADLGSRYKRLELTEARLTDQQTSFSEMLTKNDRVDIEDAVVNYTSAMTVYNASLSASAKVAQVSLLDYL